MWGFLFDLVIFFLFCRYFIKEGGVVFFSEKVNVSGGNDVY